MNLFRLYTLRRCDDAEREAQFCIYELSRRNTAINVSLDGQESNSSLR
jgi:hypothetical protein